MTVVAMYLAYFATYALYNVVMTTYNSNSMFSNAWNTNILSILSCSNISAIAQINSLLFEYTKIKIKASSATIEHVISAVKADVRIRQKVRKNSKERYWTATLKDDYVDIGRPISFGEAVEVVKRGYSVFTIYKSDARKIA